MGSSAFTPRLLWLILATNLATPAFLDEGGARERDLYEQLYTTGQYQSRGTMISQPETLLMHEVLDCPALWGPHALWGAHNATSPLSIFDAGAGRFAMLAWLELGTTEWGRSVPRPVTAVGLELSSTAIRTTPWPELRRDDKLVCSPEIPY